MSLVSVVLLHLCLFSFNFVLLEANSCKTPRKSVGKCIPMKQCGALHQALMGNATADLHRYARSSTCGYDGSLQKVCCDGDACTTPDSRPGSCIPVTQCPELSRWVRRGASLQADQRRFLADSKCGRKATVCCSFKSGTPPDRQKTSKTPVPSPKRSSRITALEDGEDRPSGQCGTLGDFAVDSKVSSPLGDQPWLAALESSSMGKHRILCGAALIGDQYVLTTADCLLRHLGELSSISLGGCNGNNVSCHSKLIVSSVTIHPKYNNDTMQNNIALIRLQQKVTFTALLKPICLPVSGMPLMSGEKALALKWLRAEEGSQRKQLKTPMTILQMKKCKKDGEGGNIYVNARTQVCLDGIKDGAQCSADSGSPLVKSFSRGGKANWYLVGLVTSQSRNICSDNGQGAHVRVQAYTPWILRNMK